MIDTYSDFTVEAAVRIVEACLAAQRPELIVPALLDRRSPESVSRQLGAASAPLSTPASASTRAAPSIFGGPTAAEQDRLQAALRQRLESLYGVKTAG